MKINSAILAAALGLASTSLASAQQYVYLTGSTAARAAVYNTFMAGAGFDGNKTAFIGYGSTTPANCSYMEFSNTIGGVITIVRCHWSGSELGIADVSNGTSESFANDALTAFPAPGVGSALASSANPATTTTSTVDFAQADNDLPYSYTVNSTATSVNDNLVIPFVFVKSSTSLTDQNLLTDINYDNFKAIAQGGSKLALFSGVNTDTTWVYLAGRDHFSGTRANCFGVTGWGIKKSPEQIMLDTTGNMTDHNGDGSYLTTEGQSSGGTLAKSLLNTGLNTDQISGNTGFIAVAYLGLADDATAEGAPYNAVRLTYCGVPYSLAAVQNGQYAFWGYEFTMKKSGIGTVANGVATALAANLGSNTSGQEIGASTMNVKRAGPTGYVTHK